VIERFGAEPNTTNNRMEIEGALRGLEILKRPCRVELVTDSQYLAKGINEWLPGWRANGYRRREGNKLKPLQNDDQWRAVDALLACHQVRVVHVRGHAGHPQNERCDQLAVAAYKTLGRRAAAGAATAQARPARAIEPASALETDIRTKTQPIDVETPAQRITPDLAATFEQDRPDFSSPASDRPGIETASSNIEPVESAPEATTPSPRKPRTPRPHKTAIDFPQESHQVEPAKLASATGAGPGASEQAEIPAPRAAARPRSAPKKRAAAPKRSKSAIQPEIEFTDPVVDPREPARWDPDDAID